MIRKLLVCLCAIIGLGGCGYHTEDYAENTPKLDIREYLNGPLTVHGMIFDWKGKASRHFTANLVGSWEGNVGTLTEDFTYSDGQKQHRIWQLRMSDDHSFTGTANDVIGTAKGTQHGNAVNMSYTLAHKDKDGSTINLSVDDWLYLTQQGDVLNRTKLYKFGVPVGEVFISFSKPPKEQMTQ